MSLKFFDSINSNTVTPLVGNSNKSVVAKFSADIRSSVTDNKSLLYHKVFV